MPTAAEVTPLNISTEEYRVYTYPNGAQLRIEKPVALYIFENKHGWTQRVVDADGLTHRPEKGWVGISWKPKAGAPAFDF